MKKKEIKKNEIKIGDRVYFFNKKRECIDEGVVSKIFEDGDIYVQIYSYTICKPYYELYRTTGEAIKEMDNWIEFQFRKLKATIHNTEDLMRFMFNNETAQTEENSYIVNRKVAIECAKELLNIDLLTNVSQEDF